MNSIRLLTPDDHVALDAFLARAPASTMMLRSNLRHSGIVDGPAPYQGAYAATFENRAITGVAGHFWSNNIVFYAPDNAGALAAFLKAHTKRPIMGLIGPWADCINALDHLGLHDRTIDKPPHQEILYDLNLADLVVPQALANGSVAVRRATMADLDTLSAWRLDYEVETLRYNRTPELEARATATMTRLIAAQEFWLATVNDTPVAMSGFNAQLPGLVQVGGVHTPVSNRGNGYARAAVARSLMDAQRAGATRGILFTEITNVPAQKAYEALGFKRIGYYGFVLLHP